MSLRVHIVGNDLLVRSRLRDVIGGAGATVSRDAGACNVAVLPAEMPGALERIRAFVSAGVAVLAYAPHVRAELLRAARDAGATAVPNSELERGLASLLTSPPA